MPDMAPPQKRRRSEWIGDEKPSAWRFMDRKICLRIKPLKGPTNDQ
jgi:hypothetical protein